MHKKLTRQNNSANGLLESANVMMSLVLLPETVGEEHEDGHNLESAHEHKQTKQPFDVFGQYGPRHGGANLGAERGPYVADTAEGDGDGIGIVDACDNHDGCGDDDHDTGEGEEGEEGYELGLWDVLSVDLDGEDGVGMEDLSEVVAHDL